MITVWRYSTLSRMRSYWSLSSIDKNYFYFLSRDNGEDLAKEQPFRWRSETSMFPSNCEIGEKTCQKQAVTFTFTSPRVIFFLSILRRSIIFSELSVTIRRDRIEKHRYHVGCNAQQKEKHADGHVICSFVHRPSARQIDNWRRESASDERERQ